ncbi:SacI homology domain-containing protein [Obelidium mucronatum]|nr:SacI homology domain-containing protein [Obelidium mucronatum]
MLDVKERYDFYTPTQYRVSNESKIFGIVGVVDLCFKKYVLSVDRRELTASVKGKRIWKITGVRATQYYSGKPFLSLNEEELERTILGHITSMLTSGLFYYSVDMDLTSSCQATLEKESARENKWSSEKLTSAGADSLSELRKEFQMIDERFMFNKYLLDSILALETYPFILPTIFGFAASTEFLLDTVTHQYCLISRCSNKRAGTRYFRGLDEHGSSAIEVETEMILVSDDRLMSYRQLRGSTPLIWKSSAPDEILQPVHIDLTGSADQTSKNALHLHLFNLVERFQTPVTLLSLLSRKHKKESLAEQYQQLADAFSKVFHEIRGNLGTGQDVDLIEFDESDLVHAGKSSMQKLMKILEPVWTKHGFFSSIVGYTADMNLNASLTDSRQHGVLRINGIDCVDMTNVVQYNVALEVMYAMLASCSVPGKLTPSQLNKVKKVWVANGRALALLYTGVPRVLVRGANPVELD